MSLLLPSLLLLLACAPQSADTGAVDGGADGGPGDGGDAGSADGGADGGTPAWTRPDFASPPDAEDLDPADDVVHIELTAAPAQHEIHGPDGTLVVQGTAYNGSTPGPTIRLKRGDRLVVDLDNQLATPTTIHWHGLHAPFAMDGVPWMTDPVRPGEQFRYEFTVDQVGTFWYHPHIDTDRQVDLGLYGVIVVTDPAEPAADVDVVAVIDDWSLAHVGDTGAAADLSDADQAHGLNGDEGLWTVNGLVHPILRPPAGSSVRLRLLDASNTGYLKLLRDDGAPLRLLATDQGLLPAAQVLDSFLLVPGDRALELSVSAARIERLDAPYSHQGGEGLGEAAPLLAIDPQGEGSEPATLVLPFPGGTPSVDPGSTDIVYVFAGDSSTGQWFINGEQFPDVTIETLALGQDAVIEVRNLSPTNHPFHLHGHSFELLSLDGLPPAWRSIEDTLDLPLYGVARLRLVADNPGDWMTHCHILPHAEGGMMTVLRVE